MHQVILPGISEFTNEQRKTVVEQLGRSGLVSVEEDMPCKTVEQSKHFMQITWMDGTQSEKGYFIYAYEYLIAHASLRQYWRIEPLPEDCQELTEKYISGLSYVNYNVLVTN